MSQENVAIVREAVDAFNRGDLDAAMQLMHPDIEWDVLADIPDATTYRGRAGVREFWESWRETFRGFRLLLDECVAVGDRHVLASFRITGEGAESGAGVEADFCQVGEVREGQVIWVGMFSTESEALEAAGLRE